jgi:hypothetical protein
MGGRRGWRRDAAAVLRLRHLGCSSVTTDPLRCRERSGTARHSVWQGLHLTGCSQKPRCIRLSLPQIAALRCLVSGSCTESLRSSPFPGDEPGSGQGAKRIAVGARSRIFDSRGRSEGGRMQGCVAEKVGGSSTDWPRGVENAAPTPAPRQHLGCHKNPPPWRVPSVTRARTKFYW